MQTSHVSVLVLLLAVVGACGGPTRGASGPEAASGRRMPDGTCAPSSVVTTTACETRTIPASNASGRTGCKSDADCSYGHRGRCVKNPFYRSNDSGTIRGEARLLAGPPPPPNETECVYDQCDTNADCGARARCACGEGEHRNTCIPLDACRADGDCGIDGLCACGTGGGANTCTPANCRTDADCGAGGSCATGASGTYCRTERDSCRSNEQCESKDDYRICDYDRSARLWKCRVVPPVPPG